MKKLAKQTRTLKTLDSQQLAQANGGVIVAAKSVVETINELLKILSM